jgi:DNA-binding winged helix-turn-helix (wHTH) protein/predicted ATPase
MLAQAGRQTAAFCPFRQYRAERARPGYVWRRRQTFHGHSTEHRVKVSNRQRPEIVPFSMPGAEVSIDPMASVRSAEDADAAEPVHALSFPPFCLDLVNEQLCRDGEIIFLKPKAFAVLRYLLENPQRLVTKTELLDNLWSGMHVGDAVLKMQLSAIRLALGDKPRAPLFIETAHGRGYRFIRAVRKLVTAPVVNETASMGWFVGREAELAHLRRALARAGAARRQVMFVTGPAGIGKTSLLEAFCDSLAGRGEMTFARGQCVNQYGVAEAYLPLLEALTRIGRASDRSALVAVLQRHATTWLSQLHGLLDGHDHPVQPTVGLVAAPERMLRELTEAMEAFARDTPLVLLLEDVHWADPSTLAWIAHVARRSDPTRLLLLATYRPLEVDAQAHLLGAVKRELELQQHCQELALSLFTRDDIDAYLAARFKAHHFPPALTQLLLARTGGSPLFLKQLLDSWIERKLLRHESDKWQLATELDTIGASTPVSIASLIECESDRLTDAERQVIEAASVAGLEFSVASVAAALGLDLVLVEESCLRLARRGQFIRSAGSVEWPDGTTAARCEFIHELYRHTTYERIGVARRAQLHHRIGERQEAAYGERAKDIAVELALHFVRGGERRRAMLYWRAAGEQSLGRSAYREAVENFEQALALLPHVRDERERLHLELELRVAVGGALGMTLGHAAPQVEQHYARARKLCQDLGETQRLAQTLSSVLIFYLVRGVYRTVCELGGSSPRLEAQTCDEQAHLEASIVVGTARAFMGELGNARQQLEQAIVFYDSTQSTQGTIQMLNTGALGRTMLGVTLWLLGYPDQGLRLQREALAIGQRFRDPCTIAMASATLTLLLQLRGDSRELLDRLDPAVAHCEKHGFIYYLSNLRMLGGVSAAAEAGDWKERLDSTMDAWKGIRATGADFGETRLCSLVALAHARSGLEAEAFHLLERALERVQSHGERWWEPELYRMLGELVLQAGVVPTTLGSRWSLPLAAAQCIEACFVRALKAACRMRAKSLELRTALALARWWQECGRAHDAQPLLQGIYSWFSEGFATRDLVEARKLLRELAPASNGDAAGQLVAELPATAG